MLFDQYRFEGAFSIPRKAAGAAARVDLRRDGVQIQQRFQPVWISDWKRVFQATQDGGQPPANCTAPHGCVCGGAV